MEFIVAENKLIVPEGIITVGFKNINEYLLKSNYEIEKVCLPSTLKIIEDNAFFDYPFIKKINIPLGVQHIGAEAFWGLDDLEEIVIPISVHTINKHAFCNCKKLKLSVPYDIKSIPSGWDKNFYANIAKVIFAK